MHFHFTWQMLLRLFPISKRIVKCATGTGIARKYRCFFCIFCDGMNDVTEFSQQKKIMNSTVLDVAINGYDEKLNKRVTIWCAERNNQYIILWNYKKRRKFVCISMRSEYSLWNDLHSSKLWWAHWMSFHFSCNFSSFSDKLVQLILNALICENSYIVIQNDWLFPRTAQKNESFSLKYFELRNFTIFFFSSNLRFIERKYDFFFFSLNNRIF